MCMCVHREKKQQVMVWDPIIEGFVGLAAASRRGCDEPQAAAWAGRQSVMSQHQCIIEWYGRSLGALRRRLARQPSGSSGDAGTIN